MKAHISAILVLLLVSVGGVINVDADEPIAVFNTLSGTAPPQGSLEIPGGM